MMGYKRNPRDTKAKRAGGKMATAESWRVARKSEYGRMVEPQEIIEELDRATRIRMADQEPIE